ncbi:DUF6046 domain-containing protein [Flavobacterium sp. Fl-318]|uniref:DUF6046 domain-containing protein n=1 Tax=Flavobacterium cupriresistens TaxID=2893885 RepID=A0ABU4R6Y4_9FLAO|nr:MULTISPECIES: DUF6046 domain-containing protein [unclassified Flavobacterium]MDX6187991.1 DUF6046 domain-containing protein [Flavobacterium sp. Fl-318]UFH42089.1 DUF6046 domain-containing protein [Flavobacterium sp. F-323]
MAEFNIKELLVRASLDYVGPVFPLWWKKNQSRYKLPDLLGVNAKQLQGAKYFMTLKVSHGEDSFLFPNEPIVSIGMSKTIVKTGTVGKKKKRSVKEYITTDDEAITIKGVCIDLSDPDKYPADQVKLINDLFEINDSIDIEDNAFFELFGIRKIVLESLDWDEMIGESGMQKYTIKALGDDDFFADLNEKDKEKTNLLS